MGGFETDGGDETFKRYAAILARCLAFLVRDNRMDIHEAEIGDEMRGKISRLDSGLSDVEEEDLLGLVHEICVGVFHREFSLESTWKEPLFLFLVFSSINVSTGGWAPPLTVGGVVSALTWIAQVVAYKCIHSEGEGNSIQMTEALGTKIRWIQDSQATVFSWVRQVGALAATHSRAEHLKPRFDTSGQDYIMDGTHVSHGALHKMVKDMRRDFFKDLRDLLEFSGCPKLINKGFSRVRDVFANVEPGYCFLSDKRNADFQDRTVVVKAMIGTGKFHNLVDGNIVWKPREVQIWRAMVAKLAMDKHRNDYVLGGDTSRGTEVSALRQRNGNRARSQYYYKDRLIHWLEYHKGEGISGKGKYIVRCFDIEYSRHCVIFLAYVLYADYMIAMMACQVGLSAPRNDVPVSDVRAGPA